MSRSRSAAAAAAEVDDLWKLATTQREEKKNAAAPLKVGNETFTLFVGQKQSGKSSLITAFHNPAKEDAPKPTVALEYLFARRSAAQTNQPKDVAHIWELGGGSKLSDLVSVPLTPRTVGRAVAAVVVDLSQPHNLAYSTAHWLSLLRDRCDACVSALRATDAPAADALVAAAVARCGGAEHVDSGLIKPMPVPVLIIGTKLDEFKDRDSVEKRAAAAYLRFVAHAHGATLLTVSAKDKVSQGNLRATLTGLLLPSAGLGKGARKEVSFDKPMVVPAGSDSFDAIFAAPPKGIDAAAFVGKRGVAEDAARRWGRVLEEYFGAAAPAVEDTASRQEAEEHEVEGFAAAAASSGATAFLEPLVDEARAARDAALAAYKKDAERKARAEAAAARPKQTARPSAGAAAKPRSSRGQEAKPSDAK